MTKKTTLKELGDMLEFVVKHMATKDDIADVKSTLADHTKIRARAAAPPQHSTQSAFNSYDKIRSHQKSGTRYR
jgi:hypothetical protein